VEEMKISGIAKDNNVARIAVVGVPDEPGVAFRVFNTMARAKINVDIILQSYGRSNTNDISFTVPLDDAERAADALRELQDSLGFDHVNVDTNVSKVSIVGAGMMSASGIAALMFEALYDAKINIQMISTSEIKVSVLIDKAYADQAVQAIHSKFFA
jgi:aspartate kinase